MLEYAMDMLERSDSRMPNVLSVMFKRACPKHMMYMSEVLEVCQH